MALLLVTSQFLVWGIITLLSGLLGGIGLASGFELFRSIRDKITNRKNKKYVSDLEEACYSQTAS